MDHVTHASLPQHVRFEGYLLCKNHAPIKIEPRSGRRADDYGVINHGNAVEGRIRVIHDVDLVLPIGHEHIAKGLGVIWIADCNLDVGHVYTSQRNP